MANIMQDSSYRLSLISQLSEETFKAEQTKKSTSLNSKEAVQLKVKLATNDLTDSQLRIAVDIVNSVKENKNQIVKRSAEDFSRFKQENMLLDYREDKIKITFKDIIAFNDVSKASFLLKNLELASLHYDLHSK